MPSSLPGRRSDQGNRTLLRRRFTAAGCQLAEIPERLKQGIQASPLDPVGPIYHTLHDEHPINIPAYLRKGNENGYQRIKEPASILQDHAPNQRRFAVLANSYPTLYVSLAAIMETGRWHKWSISISWLDEISLGVRDLILRSVAESRIQDGELLVLADSNRLIEVEKSILELITARCRLELVEVREFHSVFRIQACAPAET